MTTLISDELRRLYFYEGQPHHVQAQTGESYYPAGLLTPSLLEEHLAGTQTLALNLVADDDTCRAMVIDFDGVAHGKGQQHWDALAALVTRMQEDLGLPEPAVAVSGRKGWGIWLSLEQPLPAARARQFLRLVRSAYLDLPNDEIDLRPDTDKATKAAQAVAKLPPCLHRASGLWAAFIRPNMGESFIEEAGLIDAPPMDKQADLLRNLQSITQLQFEQALHKLLLMTGALPQERAGPSLEPIYGNADLAYLPPCIASLVTAGAPHEMQYNTANLNLSAYCHSAQLEEDVAQDLAQRMAQASEAHPSGKEARDKLRNFWSNRSSDRPFYCDFARNMPAWAIQYGGLDACAGCKLNPGIGHDKQTSHAQLSGFVLEPPVALDLLAYARDRREPLPQVRSVWPQQDGAPFYSMAARALVPGDGLTSAAFFAQLDAYFSERRISVSAQVAWQAAATSFFSQVLEHSVTEAAGKAALLRAVQMERRLALNSAAHDAINHGPAIAASVVAMQLRTAAEASLKAEQGAGPIGTFRDALFKALARQETAVVPTPFPRLNGLLHGGLRGGRLYTLIAPPKSGKTTLAGAVMDHAASLGHPCLYAGYEMAREQMVEYALARRESINSRRIETRDLSEQEAERLASSLDAYLAQTGQYLELWEAGMTTSIADMAAWVTRVKAEHPDKTPLVVIDYLQLAYTGITEIDRHPSETKRVTEVAVACKHLARQTGAAVLALSSVTKAAESDSRNSGEIDVTAARDSLAIIHASDGVLAMQTATVRVTEGKGANKTESELDPWGFIANQLRATSKDAEAATLERALLKLGKEGYAQGGSPGCGVRARLSLLRHRGSTGDVALYYRQAFHSLEEVALPGMAALETGKHNSEICINVFKKYADGEAAPASLDIEEAAPAASPSAPPAPGLVYEYLTDQAAALAAIDQLEGLVGMDLETTGLSPRTAQARLLQLSDGKRTLVIDLWKTGGLAAFKAALGPRPIWRSGLALVAHNAAFEMGFLYNAGIEVTLDCTMLAHHVLTGKQVGLKVLAQDYLGLTISKEQQVSDWSAGVLTESQLEYAALDALVVAQIFPLLQEELAQRDSAKSYQITRDAQPCIVRMALAGIGFDSEKQRALLSSLTTQRDANLAALAEALEGRNPASGAQLSDWLTQQLGGDSSPKFAAWPKTPTGKLKTGGSDLEAGLIYLPDAAAAVVREALLPFKDAEKKISAFGASLADKIDSSTQRIHAEFHLAGAETGRMSCSKPNLQQIPRDKAFRALFAAPAGRVFVICDYSQMELRVAAQIAGEESLIEAYRQGQDTPKKTAALLLGIEPAAVTKDQRQLAKAVNFGLLFGQGAKGLQAYASSSYEVEISEEQARKYRDAWFAAYPAFKVWHNKTRRAAEKSLSVRTPAGRERRWASAKEFAVTAAFNTPVQGGAAEAMLASLAHLDNSLRGIDAEPVAVVHDEVIVECAQEAAGVVLGLLEQSMIQGFKDIFPDAPVNGLVEASMGQTWADKP